MPLKVFVDFDGTMTEGDIGDAFFQHFGGEACGWHTTDYRDGRISAMECFSREAAEMRPFTIAEADAFCAAQRLIPGVPEFVEFCRLQNIPAIVVSDGLDFYIGRILRNNGLEGVTFFSNRLQLDEAGDGRYRARVEFPHSTEGCDRCACCKRNIVLTQAGEEDVIAYVGEGYSDRCVSQYADVVFAKDDLQRYCQTENISYFLYQDFFDVRTRLEELCGRKRLRKRRRAELKRREAFRCEA